MRGLVRARVAENNSGDIHFTPAYWSSFGPQICLIRFGVDILQLSKNIATLIGTHGTIARVLSFDDIFNIHHEQVNASLL